MESGRGTFANLLWDLWGKNNGRFGDWILSQLGSRGSEPYGKIGKAYKLTNLLLSALAIQLKHRINMVFYKSMGSASSLPSLINSASCWRVWADQHPSTRDLSVSQVPVWFISHQKKKTLTLGGFHSHEGTPNLMVYWLENPNLRWMRTGGTPIFRKPSFQSSPWYTLWFSLPLCLCFSFLFTRT